MFEKQTVNTAGKEAIKRVCEISLKYTTSVAASHCFTVVHLHVYVREGNSASETEKVQE